MTISMSATSTMETVWRTPSASIHLDLSTVGLVSRDTLETKNRAVPTVLASVLMELSATKMLNASVPLVSTITSVVAKLGGQEMESCADLTGI